MSSLPDSIISDDDEYSRKVVVREPQESSGSSVPSFSRSLQSDSYCPLSAARLNAAPYPTQTLSTPSCSSTFTPSVCHFPTLSAETNLSRSSSVQTLSPLSSQNISSSVSGSTLSPASSGYTLCPSSGGETHSPSSPGQTLSPASPRSLSPDCSTQDEEEPQPEKLLTFGFNPLSNISTVTITSTGRRIKSSGITPVEIADKVEQADSLFGAAAAEKLSIPRQTDGLASSSSDEDWCSPSIVGNREGNWYGGDSINRSSFERTLFERNDAKRCFEETFAARGAARGGGHLEDWAEQPCNATGSYLCGGLNRCVGSCRGAVSRNGKIDSSSSDWETQSAYMEYTDPTGADLCAETSLLVGAMTNSLRGYDEEIKCDTDDDDVSTPRSSVDAPFGTGAGDNSLQRPGVAVDAHHSSDDETDLGFCDDGVQRTLSLTNTNNSGARSSHYVVDDGDHVMSHYGKDHLTHRVLTDDDDDEEAREYSCTDRPTNDIYRGRLTAIGDKCIRGEPTGFQRVTAGLPYMDDVDSDGLIDIRGVTSKAVVVNEPWSGDKRGYNKLKSEQHTKQYDEAVTVESDDDSEIKRQQGMRSRGTATSNTGTTTAPIRRGGSTLLRVADQSPVSRTAIGTSTRCLTSSPRSTFAITTTTNSHVDSRVAFPTLDQRRFATSQYSRESKTADRWSASGVSTPRMSDNVYDYGSPNTVFSDRASVHTKSSYDYRRRDPDEKAMDRELEEEHGYKNRKNSNPDEEDDEDNYDHRVDHRTASSDSYPLGRNDDRSSRQIDTRINSQAGERGENSENEHDAQQKEKNEKFEAMKLRKRTRQKREMVCKASDITGNVGNKSVDEILSYLGEKPSTSKTSSSRTVGGGESQKSKKKKSKSKVVATALAQVMLSDEKSSEANSMSHCDDTETESHSMESSYILESSVTKASNKNTKPGHNTKITGCNGDDKSGAIVGSTCIDPTRVNSDRFHATSNATTMVKVNRTNDDVTLWAMKQTDKVRNTKMFSKNSRDSGSYDRTFKITEMLSRGKFVHDDDRDNDSEKGVFSDDQMSGNTDLVDVVVRTSKFLASQVHNDNGHVVIADSLDISEKSARAIEEMSAACHLLEQQPAIACITTKNSSIGNEAVDITSISNSAALQADDGNHSKKKSRKKVKGLAGNDIEAAVAAEDESSQEVVERANSFINSTMQQLQKTVKNNKSKTKKSSDKGGAISGKPERIGSLDSSACAEMAPVVACNVPNKSTTFTVSCRGAQLGSKSAGNGEEINGEDDEMRDATVLKIDKDSYKMDSCIVLRDDYTVDATLHECGEHRLRSPADAVNSMDLVMSCDSEPSIFAFDTLQERGTPSPQSNHVTSKELSMSCDSDSNSFVTPLFEKECISAETVTLPVQICDMTKQQSVCVEGVKKVHKSVDYKEDDERKMKAKEDNNGRLFAVNDNILTAMRTNDKGLSVQINDKNVSMTVESDNKKSIVTDENFKDNGVFIADQFPDEFLYDEDYIDVLFGTEKPVPKDENFTVVTQKKKRINRKDGGSMNEINERAEIETKQTPCRTSQNDGDSRATVTQKSNASTFSRPQLYAGNKLLLGDRKSSALNAISNGNTTHPISTRFSKSVTAAFGQTQIGKTGESSATVSRQEDSNRSRNEPYDSTRKPMENKNKAPASQKMTINCFDAPIASVTSSSSSISVHDINYTIDSKPSSISYIFSNAGSAASLTDESSDTRVPVSTVYTENTATLSVAQPLNTDRHVTTQEDSIQATSSNIGRVSHAASYDSNLSGAGNMGTTSDASRTTKSGGVVFLDTRLPTVHSMTNSNIEFSFGFDDAAEHVVLQGKNLEQMEEKHVDNVSADDVMSIPEITPMTCAEQPTNHPPGQYSPAYSSPSTPDSQQYADNNFHASHSVSSSGGGPERERSKYRRHQLSERAARQGQPSGSSAVVHPTSVPIGRPQVYYQPSVVSAQHVFMHSEVSMPMGGGMDVPSGVVNPGQVHYIHPDGAVRSYLPPGYNHRPTHHQQHPMMQSIMQPHPIMVPFVLYPPPLMHRSAYDAQQGFSPPGGIVPPTVIMCPPPHPPPNVPQSPVLSFQSHPVEGGNRSVLMSPQMLDEHRHMPEVGRRIIQGDNGSDTGVPAAMLELQQLQHRLLKCEELQQIQSCGEQLEQLTGVELQQLQHRLLKCEELQQIQSCGEQLEQLTGVEQQQHTGEQLHASEQLLQQQNRDEQLHASEQLQRRYSSEGKMQELQLQKESDDNVLSDSQAHVISASIQAVTNTGSSSARGTRTGAGQEVSSRRRLVRHEDSSSSLGRFDLKRAQEFIFKAFNDVRSTCSAADSPIVKYVADDS